MLTLPLSLFCFICYRFFRLTGRLFGFVATDLQKKISILDSLLGSTNSEHYKTVKKMFDFEIESDLLCKKVGPHKLHSGCRTLLRLHRALEFILKFMERLAEESESSSTSTIAYDVYHATLAKHHPWLIQKMAALAVYTLPQQRDLIELMCHQPYDEVLVLLRNVCDAGQPVYLIVQKFYKEANLLDLK